MKEHRHLLLHTHYSTHRRVKSFWRTPMPGTIKKNHASFHFSAVLISSVQNSWITLSRITRSKYSKGHKCFLDFFFIIKIITTLFKVKCLNVINHSLETIELRPSSTQNSPRLITCPFVTVAAQLSCIQRLQQNPTAFVTQLGSPQVWVIFSLRGSKFQKKC